MFEQSICLVYNAQLVLPYGVTRTKTIKIDNVVNLSISIVEKPYAFGQFYGGIWFLQTGFKQHPYC